LNDTLIKISLDMLLPTDITMQPPERKMAHNTSCVPTK